MSYFDYAATTPMDPRLFETWQKYSQLPLNPSSVHQNGQKARRLLENARERIAASIDLENPQNILFTSGATESANLALRGLLGSKTEEKPVILTSKLEHSCIDETIEDIEKNELADVVYLPVKADGHIDLLPVEQSPQIFCAMHANNETGVIQDIRKLKTYHEKVGGYWICDGSQSVGKIPVSVKTIGCDAFLISAHKFYGPLGIGCIAGKAVEKLRPQITGGPQEDNRRAGTQAVALALCFAEALEIAVSEMTERTKRLDDLEAYLLAKLKALERECKVNGGEPKLSGFLNISFPGHEGIDVVIAMDQMQCSVSPGSACSTGVVAVSPVLKAMYPDDEERAAGGVRISMSHNTTEAEIDHLVQSLSKIVVPLQK